MSEKALGGYELWFVAGSQEMYGDAVLAQVDADAREVAAALAEADSVPVRVVRRPVATSSEAMREVCLAANAADPISPISSPDQKSSSTLRPRGCPASASPTASTAAVPDALSSAPKWICPDSSLRASELPLLPCPR